MTFVFTNDIHACRMGTGLSPNCEQEGKTDANLLRHIAGINAVPATSGRGRSPARRPASAAPEPRSQLRSGWWSAAT